MFCFISGAIWDSLAMCGFKDYVAQAGIEFIYSDLSF